MRARARVGVKVRVRARVGVKAMVRARPKDSVGGWSRASTW